MGIKLSADFMDKWKHIIDEVDKTEVPAHLIDKLVVTIITGKDQTTQQTIDVGKMKDDGLSTIEIEDIINETLYELNDYIESVDFFLDIDSVAKEVQPETDKFLNRINNQKT